MEAEIKQTMVTVQKDDDKWQQFVEGEVIIKQGFVNKRKGLFARKRMLLLTNGPRLVYVDPVQMVKKGEIPMSRDLRSEPKNFKIFFVHTVSDTHTHTHTLQYNISSLLLKLIDCYFSSERCYRNKKQPQEKCFTTLGIFCFSRGERII